MDTCTQVLADASYLVQQDLYRHVEEAEYLAEEEWSDDHIELVRELMSELAMVIRHVLADHRATDTADCHCCQRAWPCQVVATVHSLVKDPRQHFVALATRSDQSG